MFLTKIYIKESQSGNIFQTDYTECIFHVGLSAHSSTYKLYMVASKHRDWQETHKNWDVGVFWQRTTMEVVQWWSNSFIQVYIEGKRISMWEIRTEPLLKLLGIASPYSNSNPASLMQQNSLLRASQLPTRRKCSLLLLSVLDKIEKSMKYRPGEFSY